MSDSTSSVPATLGAPSTPSTPDVSIGSTTNLCTSGRSVISVKGVKFIPNGHAISTTITETFKERQDATGYSWKNVSQSTRDFYWHEFMLLEITILKDDRFRVEAEEFIRSQPPNESGAPFQLSAEDIERLWTRAAGGPKWGKVYGLPTKTFHRDRCGMQGIGTS